MKRTRILLDIIGLASCGGDLAHSDGNTVSSDSGASNDEGGGSQRDARAGDVGTPSNDSEPPTDASIECNVGSCTTCLSCVLCHNEWHCGGGTAVFPQCPAGITSSSSCSVIEAGGTCLSCASDGIGTLYRFCSNGNQWATYPGWSCSQ